jgi:two-component system nitrate/nitrite response regulator NarL
MRTSNGDAARPTRPVSVGVVDDSPAFRRAICVSLSRDPRVKVVGTAEDGRRGLEMVLERGPAVALVDMRMPGMGGADLTRAIVARRPDAAVVALTVSEDERDLGEALRAGARGYVLKSADREEIVRAVLAATRGESWLSARMTSKLVSSYAALADHGPAGVGPQGSELSPRERSVLSHLALGMTNRQIAQALDIAETTVKSHVKSLLRKLGARNRSEATAIAWQLGRTEREKAV